MIFVTTGSAVKGIEFTRLIEKMDEVAGRLNEEIVMQIGTISYEPSHTKFFRYASYQETLSYFQKASLIVGHCGIGTILNALKFQKPIIVVPRRFRYGELNRDDHQMEIAQRIDGMPLIHVVYDVEDLQEAIRKVLSQTEPPSVSGMFQEKKELIETIQQFLNEGDET